MATLLHAPRRWLVLTMAVSMVGFVALALGHEGQEIDAQPAYDGPGSGNAPGGGLPLQFSSSGITLMSWISVPTFNSSFTSANTVEGYVSPSGREYAVIGLSGGTAFVEVTDPTNARIVTIITGPTSLWRDLRVHQNFAYAVSEGGSGMGPSASGAGASRASHSVVCPAATTTLPTWPMAAPGARAVTWCGPGSRGMVRDSGAAPADRPSTKISESRSATTLR